MHAQPWIHENIIAGDTTTVIMAPFQHI